MVKYEKSPFLGLCTVSTVSLICVGGVVVGFFVRLTFVFIFLNKGQSMKIYQTFT